MLFKLRPQSLAMKDSMPRINLKSMRDENVNPKKTKSGGG